MADSEYDIKADLYYTLVSACQKCVRRGLGDHAVTAARAAHSLEPFRFYARMHTILFEECSWDEPTLRAFYDWRGTYKDFKLLEPLVRKMANAFHSREAIPFKNVLLGRVKLDEQGLETIGHQNPYLTRMLELWNTHEFDTYRELGMPEDKEWIVNLSERCMKLDYEKICMITPLFHLEDVTRPDPVTEAPITSMLSEVGLPCLPECCLDGHTRIGSLALMTTAKKLGLNIDRNMMKGLCFFQEGRYLNNFTPFPIDVLTENLRVQDCLHLISDETQNYWKTEFAPTLQGIRKWALYKANPVITEELRKLCVS